MKFLLLLVLVAVQSDDLNLGYKYLTYATNYCGHGKVTVADIGNGNLVSKYNISEKDLATYRLESAKNPTIHQLIPKPENLDPDCSETQDKSCVGQGNTWYWCNYPEYQCMSKYVSQKEGNYTDIRVESSSQPWVFEGWLDNDSNATQTMHYSREEKTTTTYSFTFSNTVEIGYTYSITVHVPLVMDETESFSFKWSSTESKTTTKTTEKSWSIIQDVAAPPMSTMKVTTIVKKAKYTGNYHAHMELPYYAKIWCKDKIDGHYEWFDEATDFLSSCKGKICDVGGPFTGYQGINMQTSIKQCPLHSRDC